MSTKFSVICLSDPNLSEQQHQDYAQRYTSLRISALEHSAHAFSSTVETERSLTSEERVSRLTEWQKNIFVSCSDDDDGNQFVGQVTLIGPLSRAEYDQPFRLLPGTESACSPRLDSNDSMETTTTTFWHMTALYVDQRFRGYGLARLLCDACFHHIQKGQLRIIIKPDNTAVIAMYQRMGFEIQPNKATLLEAIHASRDGVDKLPPGAETLPQYTGRGGIVMMKRIPS